MPVSVPLKFNVPEDEDIVALLIEEGISQVGPFVEIEEILAVGTYPDYISEHTTTNANSKTDWFRIRWRDSGGAFTSYSIPMVGGTSLLIAKIKDRVKQRDPSLVDAIVYQEAEAIISEYFGVEDPYDESLTASYKVINGLVYLVLARCYIFQSVLSGDVEEAKLGLVSFKSSSGSRTVDIAALISLANDNLGLRTSTILQMEDVLREMPWVWLNEP